MNLCVAHNQVAHTWIVGRTGQSLGFHFREETSMNLFWQARSAIVPDRSNLGIVERV
jgi:hypothetical protein